MKTILFFRNYKGFQGGHLKVWNYFNHIMHSNSFRPLIYFSEKTIWDKSNSWLGLKDYILESKESICPSVFFLAGLDWLMLDKNQWENPPVPIINLIQHVRHSDPKELRYSFLRYKAIRICVGEEITDAIYKTGKVNGPVFTIPNGIDFQDFPKPLEYTKKECVILIAALKQPVLGHQLAQHFQKISRRVQILTSMLPRPDYLSYVNNSKATIFLPHKIEGCYLPALEGMALGTIVICPESIGTSYCLSNYNCLRPEYTLKNILIAAETALQLSNNQVKQILANALHTVAKHDLIKERNAFLNILDNVTELWRD